jgi:adenine phosphoribosyltransferase
MEKELKKAILDIPDFPKKGVIFKDITPVLQDKKLFVKLVDSLAKRYKTKKIDAVVCVDARGFLIGAPLAYKLKASLIPVRKPGKLPRAVYSQEYALEYGTDSLEMHRDAVKKGDNVLIVDDVLATGGTAGAAAKLIEKSGGNIEEICFIMALDFLNGGQKLKSYKTFSLIHY